MIDINNYMNDGAGWQAQAVLAYLKGNLGPILADAYYKTSVMVEVGRYENCREQGYVFTLRFHTKKQGCIQRNYAVYQHRNSDSICVLISNTFTINTPTWQAGHSNNHASFFTTPRLRSHTVHNLPRRETRRSRLTIKEHNSQCHPSPSRQHPTNSTQRTTRHTTLRQ